MSARTARPLAAVITLWALALGGCSITLDANAPEVTLLDGAPAALAGPFVARAPDEHLFLERGPDGATYALIYRVMEDFSNGSPMPPAPFVSQPPPGPGDFLVLSTLRVARLTDPPFEATASPAAAQLVDGTLLVLTNHDGHGEIDAWRAGDPWPGVALEVAFGTGRLDASPRALVYAAPVAAPTIETWRLDGSLHRVLPRPEIGYALFEGGDVLLGIDPCAQPPPAGSTCYHGIAHATSAARDVDLGEATFGTKEAVFPLDDQALSCTAAGLVQIPYDGSPRVLLDPTPCDGNLLAVGTQELLVCGSQGLRAVRLDGGGALVLDAQPCSGPLGLADVFGSREVVCSPVGLLVVPLDGQPPTVIDRSTVAGHPVCAAGVTDQLSASAVSCDPLGLRRIPYDGSGPSVLDDQPCLQILRAGDSSAEALYARDPVMFAPSVLSASIFAVPLDGSAPPRIALAPDGAEQLFTSGLFGTRDPLFTRDPPDRYAQGSDGWLDDWQFMVRGILPKASADRSRLRWLENAARLAPVGDLDSAAIPHGDVLHLARNVRQYQELAPGRLLVADDQALVGTQNRLILIDEAARTAERVADSVDQFLVVNWGGGAPDQLLVERVDDGGGASIALAPLPQ